eukprot:COSAG02_NODE_4644_length_5137_cov_1.950377_2_plen_97_part_00
MSAAEPSAEEAAAGGENEGEEGEVPPASLSRVEQISTDEFLVAITTQLEAVEAALPARELHAAALCEKRAAERKEQAALLQGRIDALHAKGRRLPL